eukprot:CAMPEP_0170528592 /NCGR_PEP_ID=MMETSP0209-20121228/14108_1 /TAXON_ID=665100 ORGANISM="Litonotus pictus, Strain P1" /NCGR_SAMPLE_ID=MMETSP0209 /ASSEMBLY_ACC=CAM_ASM_000301 /LENGTH=213 /DNA_ID=CAMNT_0010819933 /DNA_START=285 /DNA_END=926 /DNA_ORIENTATION=-
MYYDRTFKEVFSEDEFYLLLEHGKMEYLSTGESQLCKVGQSFKELIYVAQIHEGYTVVLEDYQGNMVANVSEGSWIGIIEYAKREDYLKNKELAASIKDGKYELIWQISATIRDKNFNKINPDDTTVEDIKDVAVNKEEDQDISQYEFLKKRNEGCIVYRFSIEDLEKLYQDKDLPYVFKNGLQTLWLSYCTEYVVGQNIHLAEYFKKFEIQK